MHAHVNTRRGFVAAIIGTLVIGGTMDTAARQQCYQLNYEECCDHRTQVIPCIFACASMEDFCCGLPRPDISPHSWNAQPQSGSGMKEEFITFASQNLCKYNPVWCDDINFDPPCCVWNTSSPEPTVNCRADSWGLYPEYCQ